MLTSFQLDLLIIIIISLIPDNRLKTVKVISLSYDLKDVQLRYLEQYNNVTLNFESWLCVYVLTYVCMHAHTYMYELNVSCI